MQARHNILVRSTGYFGDMATRQFREREAGRLADLCGPEIGLILGHVGWTSSIGAEGVITARSPDGNVTGIGWAMPSNIGLNLSYAVASGHEGKGLARLLTSLAIVDAVERHGGVDRYFQRSPRVHAQWRVTNPASGAVAIRMGLRMDPSLDFHCHTPQSGKLQFLGASAELQHAFEIAKSYLRERGDPSINHVDPFSDPFAKALIQHSFSPARPRG